MHKERKKLLKLLVTILICIIFCQFTNISALATPIKIKKNTLSLSRNFAPRIPEIPQVEKSERAKKILEGDLLQPHAFRELNHCLKSIKELIWKIEGTISRGENPAIEIKYLQAKYESLKDLDKKVRNNLTIRQIRQKHQKVGPGAQRRTANLFVHYMRNIEPILNRLEFILKENTNVYEDMALEEIGTEANFLNSIREFRVYFDKNVTIEPQRPELAPSPPSFRPSNFKPIKPDTKGKVKPAYLLQKSTKPVSVPPKNSAQTLTQTLSTESGTVGILTVTPPGPEDLEETIDVVITQEMRDLVASLNNSPARIFQWVKNNIEVEFYYGSMKGSRGTYMEKAGNDIDSVSLLLALYRAADIPCRYVTGTIELPIEKAKNLTGVNDPQKLGSLLASAGIPTTLIISGSEVIAVRIEHTWAEALVDYDPYAGAKAGEGDLWVPLSPWYKPYEHIEGEDLAQMSGFDSYTFLDDFISEVKPESPAELYKLYIEDYLKANNPGMSWQDGLKTRKMKPEKFRTLPNTLNFEVVSVNGEYAELPDNLRHKVTIYVPEVSLSYTLNLSEVVDKKVTYSYPPADEASKNLINSSGGIENVDPLAVNLLPSIKIEGEAVATGNVVYAGYYHTLRTTFNIPGQGSDFVEYPVISGAYYGIGLDPQFVSTKFLVDRIAQYISTVGDTPETTDNMDEITGEALYLAVMRYFNDVNEGDGIFAQSLKDVFLKQTSGAITGKTLVVYTLFGIPSDLEAGGFFVDAKRNIYTPISSTGDDVRELDFMILGGYNSSYHEHNLFEEFFNLEAISTVKLLSLASEQDMPIYDIDSSNIATILPLLGVDTDVKSAIQSAVAAGHVVKIHQDNLTVQNWGGAGYIDRDPTTNAAGYIISGGWAGGSTVGEGDGTAGGPGAGPTEGDPVNIANGNMFHTEEDFSVPAIGMPITIKRYYNSMVSYNGPFGYGWTYTYNETITEDPVDESLTYTAGDGGIFVYTKNPDSTYTRPPGMFSTLSKELAGFLLTEKNGTQHIFDTSGKLTSIVDRNGNTITFTYTGDDLTTINDPAGRTFTLSYNANNKIESITAPGANTWVYTYDGDDLTSITNNAGLTISYTYYTDHKMASRTNAAGGTVTFDYYSDGKTHMNLLPNGGTYVFSYNSPLRVTTVKDPEGNSTIHYYNDLGVTTGHLDPLGYEELYEYDEDLNRIKTIDKNGGITKNTYDSDGNLLTTTNQLNYTTTYTYEQNFNQVISITDPIGNVLANTYDANGNLLTTIDSEGNVIEYDYYPAGMLKSIKKAGEKKSEFTYYPDGNIEKIKDAYGNMITSTYDELGRLTSKTDAMGNTIGYLIDKAGNILTTTDAEGNVTQLTYNSLNLRTSLTDGNGNKTTYEYNNWGKLLKVTDPMGYERIFVYNLNYDLASETDKNGNTTIYDYDSVNRASRKTFPDDSEELFSYDGNNNIISITDAQGVIVKSYDQANQLTRVVDFLGNEVSYTYLSDGRKESMVDPLGGSTLYQYYKNGQLKSVTDPDGKQTEYFYQEGLLEKIVYANGTETVYTYDLNDRITDLVNRKSGGEVIASFHYEYDSVGNRIRMTDVDGDHIYQYDNIDRVTRVDYPDGSYSAYTYDPVGNRITLTTAGGSTSYLYDENNRMLLDEGTVFSYDKNGNQISKTERGITTYFQYDYKNQLKRIDYADGASNEFKYNALRQRIARVERNNIVQFTYDGIDLLMEFDGDGVIRGRYTNGILGAGPISKKDAKGDYSYYLKDAVLSVRELTDAAGEIKASFKYDIFGAVKEGTIIDDRGIRQRFTGKELDKDSGLLYFGARYYSPENGRFITADTFTWGPDDIRRGIYRDYAEVLAHQGAVTPQKLNLYVYCVNNPINQIDINGNAPSDWRSILGTILGVLGILLGVASLVIGALILFKVVAATVLVAGVTLATLGIILGIASLVAGIGSLIVNPPSSTPSWIVNTLAVLAGIASFVPGGAGLAFGAAGILLGIWGLFARRIDVEDEAAEPSKTILAGAVECKILTGNVGLSAQPAC